MRKMTCSKYTNKQQIFVYYTFSNVVRQMSKQLAKQTGMPQIFFKDRCVRNIQINVKRFASIFQWFIYEPHEIPRPFGFRNPLFVHYRKRTQVTKFKIITTKFNYQKHQKFINNKYKLMLEAIKNKHRSNYTQLVKVQYLEKNNGIFRLLFRLLKYKLIRTTIGYERFNYYK